LTVSADTMDARYSALSGRVLYPIFFKIQALFLFFWRGPGAPGFRCAQDCASLSL